jgi:nicotinate-nucleotide adenylyltransferase
MSSYKKIGLFGGTFSPPHKGHISAARNFALQEELDELLIIPAFLPPHKEISPEVTADARLQMCEIAFKDIERARVCDLEIKRQGKSYTYLTLSELSEKHKNARFVLLCGTDMILSFDTWYRFEDIFKMADIVYMRREEDEGVSLQLKEKIAQYREKYGAKIRELKGDVLEISSTQLRLSILNGENTSDFLTRETEEYIRKWNLYRGK